VRPSPGVDALLDGPGSGRRRAPWRLLTHLALFTVCWPLGSALVGTPASYTGALVDTGNVGAVRLAMLLTAAELWREFLACGLVLAALAALVSRVARGPDAGSASAGRQVLQGVLDALTVTVALALGIALELPAALNLPGPDRLPDRPVWQALLAMAAALGLVALAAGLRWSSRRLGYRHLLASAPVVALGWALARFPPAHPTPAAASNARVVLGLDSISRVDDVQGLHGLEARHGGTWYERAVSPGLLTNAVWSSILTSRPPHETGVYFVFQGPDWDALPDNLVARARAAGLRTHSFFSDQLTTYVGADLPFDAPASGPKGWKQATTVAVKDASWFLPVLLPRLPPLPGAAAPRNQAGTYAFSIRRELQDVLAAGTEPGGSLVLAHVDYLHQPRYPGLSELDPAQRRRVLSARRRAVTDGSFNWQYPRIADAPFDLYAWKLRHLQELVAAAVDEARLLEAGRGNTLVVLSDHGPREGVRDDAFGNEQYYGAVLLTFGVPPRAPSEPISLMDVPALLGLPAAGLGPAEPVTEYVNLPANEWPPLFRDAVPLRDGGVRLPRAALEAIGARLRSFRPYTEPRGYSLTRAVPAGEPDRAAILVGRGS
jgi:hypothetical protein